jgi:hypothetical protein
MCRNLRKQGIERSVVYFRCSNTTTADALSDHMERADYCDEINLTTYEA